MILTDEQQVILQGIINWAELGRSPVAILNGGAGTGKTTLLKSVVDGLQNLKISCGLLAPTGRAARILSRKTGRATRTIHSEIYTLGEIVTNDELGAGQGVFESPGFVISFTLKDVDPGYTVFIVDEASLVSDESTQNEILSFGSGRLLYDLLQYARIFNKNSINSKILFVGDQAQLPPIKSKQSPALTKSYFFDEYGIDSEIFQLDKVLRQGEGSLVLENAEKIRESIRVNEFKNFRIAGNGSTVYSGPIRQDRNPSSLSWRARPSRSCLALPHSC